MRHQRRCGPWTGGVPVGLLVLALSIVGCAPTRPAAGDGTTTRQGAGTSGEVPLDREVLDGLELRADYEPFEHPRDLFASADVVAVGRIRRVTTSSNEAALAFAIIELDVDELIKPAAGISSTVRVRAMASDPGSWEAAATGLEGRRLLVAGEALPADSDPPADLSVFTEGLQLELDGAVDALLQDPDEVADAFNVSALEELTAAMRDGAS